MARKNLTNDKIFESNLKVKRNRFLYLSINSMFRCWYYSIPALIFSSFIVGFLVENIFITSKITNILVSQNFVDIVTDKKSIAKILLCGNILDPKTFDSDYRKIMEQQTTIPSSSIQELIKDLYNYDIIVTSINGKLILSAQIWPVSLLYSDQSLNPGMTVQQLSIFIAFNLLVVIVSTYLTYLFAGYMAESEKSRIKNKLISKLIDQDIHYINHNKISNLVGTIVNGTEVYAKNLKLIPMLTYQAIATIIETTFIMFNINVWMTWTIFGNIAFIGVIIALVITLKKISNKSIAKNKKTVDDTVSERLHAMQLVKSSGTWAEETNYLKELNYKISKKTMRSLPLTELMSAIIIGGIGTFAMCSIIMGIFKYNRDINTLLSVMTTFTTAALVITLPLLQLNAVLPELQKCEKASRDIDRILRSKKMIQQNGKIVFKHLNDSIEIDNISFSYPDKSEEFYLVDQSFKFERGKRYAFIGATGSGKSTISKLLIRFYDPTVGCVKVDGIDLRDYNLKSWLDKVGYVEQEPQILSGTILENIKYVKPEATNEEVMEACKKAKIHDFIMSLNDKYNTVLFEKGAQLSGGQKQRLVIARMFVKNPDVLILDEPTSALDNIVESEIQEELEKLMIGRTTIAIAHRLNTIKNFDHIIVLGYKQGVIKRSSFAELCKTDKGILDMIKQ